MMNFTLFHLESGLDQFNTLVWDYLLIPLLLGIGLFLTIRFRFFAWNKLTDGFGYLIQSRKFHPGHKGELTPFRAMMLALAATIGTGNITGVAAAILLGGPGAVFWMWIAALLGMTTAFCETVLAVHYREITIDGSYVGGPMYYIKNGLGKHWHWLATLFASFGIITAFGIGNLFQSNQIAKTVFLQTDIPNEVIASALFLAAVIVLTGGIKRIGMIAGVLVPLMVVLYFCSGLAILIIHWDRIPGAFAVIFQSAFTGHSAAGGFTGAALMMTIKSGVTRSIASNEAGLGSIGIAHAVARTNSPVKQGLLGMLTPFIDTIIVCTISALIILVSGQWLIESDPMEPNKAAALTTLAFQKVLPNGLGGWLLTVSMVLFALTSILGWCVYGERCAIYLFGYSAALPFRLLFTLMIPVGAITKLGFIWTFADMCDGLMALPNLIALILLYPIVYKLTNEYVRKKKS